MPMVQLGGWTELKESIDIKRWEGPRLHPLDTSRKYQQAFLHLSLMSHDPGFKNDKTGLIFMVFDKTNLVRF
jgi:hypothetical protein